MTDCLILGFYDSELSAHVRRVRKMGEDTGAFKDLALSFVEHDGRPLRALEALDHFRHGRGEGVGGPPLHNADFFWPSILVLGTTLSRRGHSFDYVNLPGLERAKLAERLSDPNLRSVAITTTLYVTPEPILELVSIIRQHNPRVTIVVGGPYVAGQGATLDAVSLDGQFSYLGGDVYVISSEGEVALANVVDALKGRRTLESVPNIAYRVGGSFVRTASETEYNPLGLNRIDYGLFAGADFNEFLNVRTAKSCPFSCAFCGFPERAGDYTYLSVEEVAEELERIAGLGVTTLYVIDDTFNVPKARFKELLRMMRDRKFGIRWQSFYRSDHGDEETIDLMAQAGCEGVILGIESGSDRMLKLMNKTTSRKKYADAIPRLESSGIACYASVIVGFPGETTESVEESISLIESARPSYYRAQLWYCDPITPVARQRERFQLEGEGFNWRHASMDVGQACDHIDRMYLSIGNSTWMPQFGFEFWSTFYLRRKGMVKERVDDFLRAFNSGVCDKLLRPAAHDLTPGRAAAIGRRASLTEARAPEAGEQPHHDWAAYRAAEARWAELFRRPLLGLGEGAVRHGGVPAAPDAWSHVRVRWSEGERATGEALALAWVQALWGRWTPLELGLLWLRDEGGAAWPFRLELPVGTALASVRAALDVRPSEAELGFANSVVGTPIRLRSLGATPPVFSAAILAGDDAPTALADSFRHHPALGVNLEYVLLVREVGGGVDVQVATRTGAADAERLASELVAAWRARDTVHELLPTPVPRALGNERRDEDDVFQFGA